MKKTLILSSFVLLVSLLLVGCGAQDNTVAEQQRGGYYPYVQDIQLTDENNSLAAVDTIKGVLVIELFDTKTPVTVDNFKALVASDFYNGIEFYNVHPGFAIYAGDPKGTGTADSGTEPIALEVHPDLSHDRAGVVGMARVKTEPDSATSHFYITLSEQPDLDGQYAIFGQVVKGQGILETIEKNDVIKVIEIFEANEL